LKKTELLSPSPHCEFCWEIMMTEPNSKWGTTHRTTSKYRASYRLQERIDILCRMLFIFLYVIRIFYQQGFLSSYCEVSTSLCHEYFNMVIAIGNFATIVADLAFIFNNNKRHLSKNKHAKITSMHLSF
jgi:hypothetical protein